MSGIAIYAADGTVLHQWINTRVKYGRGKFNREIRHESEAEVT